MKHLVDLDLFEDETESSDYPLDMPEKYQAIMPSPMLRGADWARRIDWRVPKYSASPITQWFIECQLHGVEMLRATVNIDKDIRGGIPVLQGTRFPVSQLIAELADTSAPDEIADNFDLNADQIRAFLDGFALLLDKPAST